jgi:hypothetical protein
MYDAICYNGTDGFWWIGMSQFIIVFMAMIIITCRSVLYDGVEAHGHDPDTSSDNDPESMEIDHEENIKGSDQQECSPLPECPVRSEISENVDIAELVVWKGTYKGFHSIRVEM